MPVPSAITDLSTTPASNYPAGTDSPSTLDDVQRAHASFIRQLYNGDTALYTPSGTGAVATTVQTKLRESVSVKDFGADPTGVASSTTAFNSAITAAMAAGSSLYIPSGTYLLGTLNDITASITIYGDGAGTVLKFNTTGKCFNVNPAGVAQQRNNFTFRDLKFINVTSTPASFICNSNGLNVLIDRCYFTDCFVTYAVDQASGYGFTLRSCVFSDITGTGLILRDNNALPNYSFITKVDRCDFTRCSVDSVEMQGTGVGPVVFDTCVIEASGGMGVRANTKVGGGFSWNVIFNGCYFELNTSFDISINPNGSAIQSYAMLNACQFSGTPTIDLGNNGRLQINTCTNSGGNICVISGSANSSVQLHNSLNFSQSGTYTWTDDVNDTSDSPVSYTPTWGSSGTAPVIGNGTIVGKYTRKGRLVTASIVITMGSTTTYGTGFYFITLPIAAASNGQVGSIQMLRLGSSAWSGFITTVSGVSAYTLNTTSGGATNGSTSVSPTSPATWVANDSFSISITYWV